jgi:hypothetical protein
MPQIIAHPFDYTFDCVEQLALLVIDMQVCFIEPEGFASSLGNDVNNLGAWLVQCAKRNSARRRILPWGARVSAFSEICRFDRHCVEL